MEKITKTILNFDFNIEKNRSTIIIFSMYLFLLPIDNITVYINILLLLLAFVNEYITDIVYCVILVSLLNVKFFYYDLSTIYDGLIQLECHCIIIMIYNILNYCFLLGYINAVICFLEFENIKIKIQKDIKKMFENFDETLTKLDIKDKKK